MPYDSHSVLNNDRPYTVINSIISNDGNFGAAISRETNLNQPLVSEIISFLEKNELLVKGERTRTQNYRMNYEGCRDYLLNHIEEETGKTVYEHNEVGIFVVEDLEKKINSKLPKLYELYLEEYCEIKNQSTVHKMLVSDFFEDLDWGAGLPDWLDLVRKIGVEELEYRSTARGMQEAIEEINN